MVIIGLNSVHNPFNQAGMREERNPFEASSLWGYLFAKVLTQKTRLNTGLQGLWHEIYYNSNRESCHQSE